MKVGRIFVALFIAGIFAALAIEGGFNLYWKMSLAPRLKQHGAVDSATGQIELSRVLYVEQTARQFLNFPSTAQRLSVTPVPDVILTAEQKQGVNQARRLPVWFKRAEFIRKLNIDSNWMGSLEHIEAWRTPYSGVRAKGGIFLGATWAVVRLASVSKMGMSEEESLRVLKDVRQLERLLLTSESHILNLQGLQVIAIERDFVQRHRRLFSYLNHWNLPPDNFASQYRATSAWLPKIWSWGVTSDLLQQLESATHSNPIFCSAMEQGMSNALNFRPLLSSKDPIFFQRQMRWGVEWASVCHRPEFAAAWKNPNYVPGGVKEWYAVWNGHSSRWLKMKNIMWWRSARVLIGGQVWLSKALDLALTDESEN